MANGHGGKRPGAGRPKKPLCDKILEDSTRKHRPKVLDIDKTAPVPTEMPDYLDELACLDIEPDITDTYKSVVTWLERTGCLHLINPDFIGEYCLLKTRWLECEFLVKTKFLFETGTGAPAQNPAFEMGLKYLKQADVVWNKIWCVVAQNCEKYFGGYDPHAALMEKLIGLHGDE